MNSSETVLALLHYYFDKKYYNHVRMQVNEGLRGQIGDPALLYWKSVSMILEKKYAESIREMLPLQEKRDLILAAPVAMIYAHEKCDLVDREAVDELHAHLTIAHTNASVSERAYVNAALFLLYAGNYEEARKYIKGALDAKPNSPLPMAVSGWIDLKCEEKKLRQKSIKTFESILERDPRFLLALMGSLSYYRQFNDSTKAMDIASKTIVYFPTLAPAYVERLYILLEQMKWDQMGEASSRLFQVDDNCIDALFILAIKDLCLGREMGEIVGYLSTLEKVVEAKEPSNGGLSYTIARILSRLSNRHKEILEISSNFVERAIHLEPKNGMYLCELGYIQLRLGYYDKARMTFQATRAQDPQNLHALEGYIRCELFEAHYESAAEQLEFLNEIQLSMGKSSEVAYLMSLLNWFYFKNGERRMRYLKEAVEIQKSEERKTFSIENLIDLNLDLLIEIAEDYVEMCPSDPLRESEKPYPEILAAQDVLAIIQKMTPGAIKPLFLNAKLKYICREMELAQSLVEQCLRLCPVYSKAHLLLAQIHLQTGNHQSAKRSLEMAMSYDFDIRHIPLFYLLKARTLKLEGALDEAVALLKDATSLPEVRETMQTERTPRSKQKTITTNSEKVAIFLELAITYAKMKKNTEASEVIHDANVLFAGTVEEGQIALTNAELAMERGDMDTALVHLGTIGPNHSVYLEATKRMGDIYLKEKRDKKAYLRKYMELAEKNPVVESYFLLGEAYMVIQEPEKAIAVYETTIQKYPDTTFLMTKIGKALIKTHDYKRAVSYYESALAKESMSPTSLRFDLGELYYKLKQYTDSERVLRDGIGKSNEDSFPKDTIKFLVLLSKVYRDSSQMAISLECLERALDVQKRFLAKEILLDPAEKRAGALLASDICCESAERYISLKDNDNALNQYTKALEFEPGNTKALIALAKLHLKTSDYTASQNYCSQVLKLDVGNEEATLMISDIMYKKVSFSYAVFHLQQLLSQKPTHYLALSKLVDLLRRIGKLEEAEKYFTAIEKIGFKVQSSPGYHYCKGLYMKFANDPDAAIQHLSRARQDPNYKQLAIHHMIDILLNPDNETVGGETLEGVTDQTGSNKNMDNMDNELISILTAEKLVKELAVPKTVRRQVVECQILMATKQKTEIERALTKLTDILNRERDFVPALLAIASAYMLLKQPPKARNHLKRIAKMEWDSEFSEEFEKSWLLLADIYIQGGKFDLSQELLKKTLTYNKSCSVAWEYLGFIMEKEQAYRDASDHYENAWKYDKENNAAVGYKLAFNYLKAKRFVEAIDICHRVLKVYPEYPKIRKEILDKARMNLRMPV